ncbi:MAG: hypothetical protein BIP78_0756 [Candidatus Bipolaricaulis sibiricus]|uniref:Uncharacterized protein n=1 Tax=Bipolaricaulis sibiricus TaxID=2501609 RepID=A0A410FU57_BIPS1|nr:MAG: hypothetical protein BIP78_0756 [Candidatus Bipolaricaulis sibiricus]
MRATKEAKSHADEGEEGGEAQAAEEAVRLLLRDTSRSAMTRG